MDVSAYGWFYSSLAQVSAAIVGLIGAVLGTRLVSHIPDMRAALVNVHSRMSNVSAAFAERLTYFSRHFAQVFSDATLLSRMTAAYQPFAGLLSEHSIRERVELLRQTAATIQGQSGGEEQVRSQINHDANVLADLADELRSFHSRLVPRPFRAVLAILGFLAMTGILWPLGALPGSMTPFFPKFWMMVTLIIALIGLTVYFLFELVTLARLGRIQWPARR